MKKITIGFSKAESKFAIFAKLIQLVLGTSFSHTYIKFKSESIDRILIYQASGLAVNFMPEHRFLEHHVPIAEYELEVSEETYKKTIQFAVDKSGTPYGITQILGILYIKLLGCLGITVKNPFSTGTNNYICSELVTEILREILELNFYYDLDSVTPKELYNFMKETYG